MSHVASFFLTLSWRRRCVTALWRHGITERTWGCCGTASWPDGPPRSADCPVSSGRTPRPPPPCGGRSAKTRISFSTWGCLERKTPPTAGSPCQSFLSCGTHTPKKMYTPIYTPTNRLRRMKETRRTYSTFPCPSALSLTTFPSRISWVFTVEISPSLFPLESG